jgi:Kelch motif protein/galactose oxidase-like protein
MKNRRRLVLWLSLTALVVPLTIVLIVSRGMVIEIKASAATPPLLPDADELARAAGVPLPVAGDVLVSGGMGAGRASFKTIGKAEYYNPSKRAFFTTGTMPVTAADQTALAVSSLAGAKIAAFGGISGKVHSTVNLLSFIGTVMAGVETYDPTTGKWTAGANMMLSPRTGATATLLPSGKILIAGGFSNNGSPALNTAEIYDPSNGTFVATDNNMTDPRAFHTATLLANGKVLLDSGMTDNTGNLSTTADLFDPTAGIHGVFTPSTGTPGPRAAAVSVIFPSGPKAGKVLITGGDKCNGTLDICSSTDADVYNPVTDVFTFVPMNESRMNHTATLLNDGTVLVAGGINVSAGLNLGTVLGGGALTTFSRSAEIFDPSSSTFTCVGGPGTLSGCPATMTHTRAGHTATPLGDHTVLIAGGFTSFGRPPFQMGTATNSAETYDPMAKTFTKTKPMHGPRGGHTAVLLQ